MTTLIVFVSLITVTRILVYRNRIRLDTFWIILPIISEEGISLFIFSLVFNLVEVKKNKFDFLKIDLRLSSLFFHTQILQLSELMKTQ